LKYILPEFFHLASLLQVCQLGVPVDQLLQRFDLDLLPVLLPSPLMELNAFRLKSHFLLQWLHRDPCVPRSVLPGNCDPRSDLVLPSLLSINPKETQPCRFSMRAVGKYTTAPADFNPFWNAFHTLKKFCFLIKTKKQKVIQI
jgi:hypothetical protein